MSISDKIRKSKAEIKHSQKLNVSSELFRILEELESRKTDKEFLMTIPVSIVSSNESFFKETISELINFDEKFLNNSKSLIKKNNIKIEIGDIFYLTKSTYTLGDLIAYSLKYSSIESLYKSFSEISNFNILDIKPEVLKKFIEDYEEEEFINEKRPFDKNRIFKNLKEAYEIRNIICHDFLSATHKLKLNYETIKNYLIDNYIFQELTTYMLSEEIYSKVLPNTHEESVEYYSTIVEEKTKILDGLYEIISKELDTNEQIENFKKNKENFDIFLESDSKCVANNYRDPNDILFYELCLEYKAKLLDQRIRNMKDEINYSS
ncbi:hypothetical protein [Flavobacterium sp. N2270]|uniref:hypothetical protein n=1 Tax=Flavobacterium sp. N2270 TaxID=2986831 RepID=UPI0022244470|nr:hypothetical protein [Flavobacterium sp. N2270]